MATTPPTAGERCCRRAGITPHLVAPDRDVDISFVQQGHPPITYNLQVDRRPTTLLPHCTQNQTLRTSGPKSCNQGLVQLWPRLTLSNVVHYSASRVLEELEGCRSNGKLY